MRVCASTKSHLVYWISTYVFLVANHSNISSTRVASSVARRQQHAREERYLARSHRVVRIDRQSRQRVSYPGDNLAAV